MVRMVPVTGVSRGSTRYESFIMFELNIIIHGMSCIPSRKNCRVFLISRESVGENEIKFFVVENFTENNN